MEIIEIVLSYNLEVILIKCYSSNSSQLYAYYIEFNQAVNLKEKEQPTKY